MGQVSPTGYRHPSVTARCLEDDLEFHVPLPEEAMRAHLDHPLLGELVDRTPTFPQGNKPISSLHARDWPAFRLQTGRWRGCAYQHHEDDPIDIIWLTAGELRRDGDHDDAYNHFIRLHESGHLHPTPEDLLGAFTEELIWYVIPRAADNAVDVIRDALGDPEVPYESMDPTLPVATAATVIPDEPEGIAEIHVGFWSARSVTDLGQEFLHGEILRHISERLQIPNDWVVGYSNALPKDLTATYGTIIGYDDSL